MSCVRSPSSQTAHLRSTSRRAQSGNSQLTALFISIFSSCTILPASLYAAPKARADTGVHFAGDAIAAPRGALSLNTNPAGLALLRSYEARLQLSGGGGSIGGTRGAGWGAYLAVPAGGLQFAFGAERLADVTDGIGRARGAFSVTRLSFAASTMLGERLSFGIAARAHTGIGGSPTSWDAGLLYRPWSWLSVAWRATGLTSSSTPARDGDRPAFVTRWSWGLAVRPFAGSDRLTLAWDITWPSGDNLGSSTAQIRVRVVDGVTVLGEFRSYQRNATTDASSGKDTRASLLLDLGFGQWGVDVGARADRSAEAVESGGLQLGLRLSGDAPHALMHVGDTAVVVPLRGALSEAAGSANHFGLLLLRLDRMANDPHIKLVVFRSDGAKFTWSQVEEMRAAIGQLRARGKRTAWYGAGLGTRGYMIATACERIGMSETGALAARGFGTDFVGLSEALTRIGVTVEAVRYGDYKSGPEMFTRQHISTQLAATYSRIIRRRWATFVAAVALGRSLAPTQVEAALSRGVTFPEDAQRALLIDVVAEPEVFEQKLRSWGMLAADNRLHKFHAIARRRSRWGARSKIAVLTITGNIVDGKSGTGVLGSQVGGAQTARTIDRLRGDSGVKALVARIDSGGGAVWGSDAMYQALLRFSKDKPSVASMASMAASGGYWTALGADHLMASRSTITGSIGIWVIKPDISRLMSRFGVGIHHVGAGPHHDLTSILRPWTSGERTLVRRVLGRYYDVFLKRVTLRRHIERPKLLSLAEGRLWLGDEAVSNGLIDATGGLLQAIHEARGRANLAGDTDVEVAFLPQLGFVAQLRANFGVWTGRTAAADTHVVLRALQQAAGPWLERAVLLAHLPKGTPLVLAPVLRDTGAK